MLPDFYTITFISLKNHFLACPPLSVVCGESQTRMCPPLSVVCGESQTRMYYDIKINTTKMRAKYCFTKNPILHLEELKGIVSDSNNIFL